jgi:hypothetical protein
VWSYKCSAIVGHCHNALLLNLTAGPVFSDRYIWESKADGNFAVIEDTENEPLGRGTEIRIHLKEEASEYAQEDKLQVSIGRDGLGSIHTIVNLFLLS